LGDGLSEAKLHHRGQHELRDALRAAVVKPRGESWIYSRSRSRGDVSPLVAAAVALYVAELELQTGEAAELAIYY
jgi:hypothetical protein